MQLCLNHKAALQPNLENAIVKTIIKWLLFRF